MLWIIVSICIFFLGVVFHLLWCRSGKKKSLQIHVFLLFMCYGFLMYLGIVSWWNHFSNPRIPLTFWNIPLYKSAGMIYLLLVPLYIIFYFGTHVESPSHQILSLIKCHGELSHQELSSFLTDSILIKPRLDDLIRCGYLVFDGKYFRLTARGVRTARFLNIYQKILGRGMGG